MKKYFLTLLASALTLTGALGQTYVSLKDTVWGARYFSTDTSTGQPSTTGNKESKGQLTWPSANNRVIKYYIHASAGHTKADMYYTPRAARRLNLSLTVTNQTNKRVIYSDTITTDFAFNTAEKSLELIPDIYFPADAWYQIRLAPADNDYRSAPQRIRYFIFQHESANRVVTPTVFMAPSAHNNTWTSTQPYAPSGNEYDWAYGEFLYPEEYSFPNRYLMCLGGSGYYSGIQLASTDRHSTALFSIWDNGDTDKDPNLPAYLRSGAVDHNDGVAINRFGGEGTGTQSMISAAHWRPGHWVQWLMNARPETAEAVLTARDGSDSIITYPYTVMSAWYKMADDDQWFYISTQRQSGTTHLFGQNSEYSFLENFTDGGGDNYVRCYMKNRFFRSVGSGKWYNRNHITPGHYNYNDGARECRYDYGHGATELYPNCFYIEHGDFGQVNDSSMYVALPASTECVDTIDLDSKQARIDLAYRNQNYSRTVRAVDSLAALDDSYLLAYAKNLIDNAGEVGSYGAADLSSVVSAYNNGAPADMETLKTALKNVARSNNLIRFANVTQRAHVGADRAYILQNTQGYGLLYCATENGAPVIKAGKIDRSDPAANWMVVRSDQFSTLYLYNIGAGLYLNTASPNFLSSQPHALGAFLRTGRGWAVGNSSDSCLVASQDGSVSVGAMRGTGAQFYLHDNLSFTPKSALSDSVVALCEADNRFSEYKAMVPGILATPDSVVGAWTDAGQKAQLAALYDDGNITKDKADELIRLIDNAQTISLPQEEAGVFQIVSAKEANASTPYLTIDNDSYLYHKASTVKPDQVWLTLPKAGGWELSSQGVSLKGLPTNSGSNVTTAAQGNGSAYFLNPLSSGQYTLSDVQYGPMVLGSDDSPLRSVASSLADQGWYLRPARQVRFSLNSVGVGTLYLDFDVLIPEGLEAYTVDGLDGNGPLLSPVTDTIFARTPVILKGDSYGNYLFTILQSRTLREVSTPLQGTLLRKTGLKTRNFYTVTARNGVPMLSQTVGTTVNANQCYILKETMDSLGLTEARYTIDFNNITAVSTAVAESKEKDDTRAWNLRGQIADPDAKGIIIRKGQKVLNR